MLMRQSSLSVPHSARRRRLGRPGNPYRPEAELLERRLVLAGNVQISLAGANAISSFAGVGFALNPVASITGTVNGVIDNKPGDYQVQIDWGDGGGLDSNVKLASVGNQVLVKGSHIYQTASAAPPYSVTVHVTLMGQTTSAVTTSAPVDALPDAASTPPEAPTAYSGAQPTANVTLSLAGANAIDAFAGVGFALNPVAAITGTYKGSLDNTPGDYHAQINWGDSPAWDTNTRLVASGNTVLIKGTHNFQATGDYDVTVYVTGPDGQTISSTTTRVIVSLLPDPASRPPDVPESQSGPQPLGTVTLSLAGANAIDAFAGVGFALNPVGAITGSYNGNLDNTAGDYQVQINWGDSPSWDTNVGLATSGNTVLIKGTHIYQGAGDYDVTVYVTGPDGQTISDTTTRVIVSLLPDPASRPPDVPASQSGAKPLGNVTLSLAGANAIDAFAGKEFDPSPLGSVSGSYNGQTDKTPSHYHAQVNWGDSPSWDTSATLAAVGNAIQISGSHTYDDPGQFDVTLYVTGPDGQTISDNTTVVVVSPILINATSQTINTTEGTPFDGAVASFTVNDPNAQASDYSATIDWGDGTNQDTGDIAANANGGFDVTGKHTYTSAANSLPVTVTINATGSASASATADSTAHVADAMLTASGTTIQATQGMAFTGTVATFTDAYANDPKGTNEFTASIVWGDSTTSAGTLTAQGGGQYAIAGTHTYSQVNPSIPITVNIKDVEGATATAQSTADVSAPISPITVMLNAPDVNDTNAASEVPYTFTLVFQTSGGFVSKASIPGATVQVIAPNQETIAATLVSTVASGTTDAQGDGSTITATYHITPLNGDWHQSPFGTYTVALSGAPVTGVSGGQAPQGNVGMFQVSLAVMLIAEVPQFDTTVPSDGTIPVTVRAVGGSGNTDTAINGTGTIQLNGKVVANIVLKNGAANVTIPAPSQAGTYLLKGSVSTLVSTGTDVNVESESSPAGKLFDLAVENAGTLAETLKGLLEDTLGDSRELEKKAIESLEGVASKLGVVVTGLTFVPLAKDLVSLVFDLNQHNQAKFAEDFSDTVKDSLLLGIKWGTAIVVDTNPVGAVGGLLLNTTIEKGAEGLYKTFLEEGFKTEGGNLYQSLTGTGSSTLLNQGTSYTPGAGDPPPSIILVNPVGQAAGASNLSAAGQTVYAQAGASFNGNVATFLDATGNTNPSLYTADIAWGDGNFTPATVAALPGGGFTVSGSDSYATPGIYTVTVVVSRADGSSASAYDTAVVYPAGPNGSTPAPAVNVLAPNVDAGNADWVAPYTFSVVYQDTAMVSAASVAGSSVQVQPPSGPALNAQAISTQVLGTTDSQGNGTTIIVTYEFLPTGGNWYAAPPGTYTIKLSGSPVTDLSGHPVALGSAGTFQASAPPTIDAAPAVDIESGTGATISNSADVALSGFAEAGSTVNVFNGSTTVGTVTAGADGSWSFTYHAPQDGHYDFTVTSQDNQGNTSAPSTDAPVEVDTIAPTGSVTPLPANSGTSFTVSWSGTDDPNGTGISSFDVDVSDNGGPFVPWLTATPLISSTYIGAYGHTYAFYAVARDGAGNALPANPTPQATTQTTPGPLRVVGINPSANFLTALPNNQVVVTFNRALAGLVADQPNGSGFASNPFAVMLIPAGPDGQATAQATGVFWSAPSGHDNGDLPLPATAVYHVNPDGSSTITLTPQQPLSTDIYLIEINGEHDLFGNPLATDAAGDPGVVFSSFDYRPPNNLPAPAVTGVTANNGLVVINNSNIPQPDTIGIHFNKPMDTFTINTNTVQLFQQGVNGPLAAAVAYSPSTQSAYLTPETTLHPGAIYYVSVNTGVTDDENFAGSGVPLSRPFFTSFTVSANAVGAGSSPLRVNATNPPDHTAWTQPLGYGTVTFSEPINLNSLGRFSVMLISQTGGVTTGTSGYADVPLNDKLAFNPNTNQLIIIPTGQLRNHVVYLFAISGVQASNGDSLSGGTYATFLLSNGVAPNLAARPAVGSVVVVNPVVVSAGSTPVVPTAPQRAVPPGPLSASFPRAPGRTSPAQALVSTTRQRQLG